MPPRARKTASKPAEPEPPQEDAPSSGEPAEGQGSDLCRECFPAGWPPEAYSAGCAHGSYLHHERAAAIGG